MATRKQTKKQTPETPVAGGVVNNPPTEKDFLLLKEKYNSLAEQYNKAVARIKELEASGSGAASGSELEKENQRLRNEIKSLKLLVNG